MDTGVAAIGHPAVLGPNNRRSGDTRIDHRCERVLGAVASLLKIPVRTLKSPGRGADVCHARHIAIYLTHVVFGLSLSQAATAFGLHRSTISHACHKIEDLREDAEFDRLIDNLEMLVSDQAKGA
ncbi:MAG TPA: hypothetical protein DCL48_07500 [Alphaproteobacteria bacterium]|nr:hypothetical protein [Alphaproteobacteria bacterium]